MCRKMQRCFIISTLHLMMQIILSIVTVLGAISAAIFAYRTNVTSVSSSVMSLQKERISLMEAKQEEYEEALKKMSTELTIIKGENGVLSAILQGRDPRNIAFMDLVTTVANIAIPHMEKIEKRIDLIAKKIGVVFPK